MHQKFLTFSFPFIIGLKWFAILNINMTGSLKLVSIFIIFTTITIQFYKHSASRIGIFSALSICIFILLKLLYGTELGGGATSFEGISFVYLALVLPFFHVDRSLILEDEKIFISTVLFFLTMSLVTDVFMRLATHGISVFLNPLIYTLAKFGGLYPTSNVAGGLAVICFALSLHFNRPLFLTFSLFTLLLSLSRVSVLASAMALVYHVFFVSGKRSHKWLISVLFSYLLIKYSGFLYNYIVYDGSFNSKIDLFLIGFDRFFQNNQFWLVLFGFESNPEKIAAILDLNGWSPHLSSLKALLYWGVLGLIIWSVLHLYALFVSRIKSIVIAGLVMGLAGLPIFWPGIVFSLLFQRNKRISNEKLM